MTKYEIAKRIADNHNRIANAISSGGMKLLNADSVVLMGDVIKDLRNIAQQISLDLEAEKTESDKEQGEAKK